MASKTSKYKGVSWHKATGKWRAQVNFNGKGIDIGYFEKEEDARNAYEVKERELHGKIYDKLLPIFDYENRIVKIPLSSNGHNKSKKYGLHYAIIDLDDYNLVRQHTWVFSSGYAGGVLNGRIILMHNLIMHTKGIDHADGDKLNNRRYNLRRANQSQNGANRDKNKNNTSGFKGVYYHKVSGKWMAEIMKERKHIYLGLFTSPEEASIVYNKKAFELFGNFAR